MALARFVAIVVSFELWCDSSNAETEVLSTLESVDQRYSRVWWATHELVRNVISEMIQGLAMKISSAIFFACRGLLFMIDQNSADVFSGVDYNHSKNVCDWNSTTSWPFLKRVQFYHGKA